jgi:predicted ABC-class ATPase
MERLRQILKQIDHKGYKAYKSIQGTYRFPQYELAIDYVQGDPFASPSKIRIIIPWEQTILTREDTLTRKRTIHIEDYITRQIHRAIQRVGKQVNGSGKSGLIWIDPPGQEVLETMAVTISPRYLTVCLSIGLPARGRTVLGKEAERLLFEQLPTVLQQSVFSLKRESITSVIHLCDQQAAIREYMKKHGLVAFIGNGAILPRESGVSDRPLKQGAVPFQSPKELEVGIPVPHQQEPIRGMGIRKGITLIVGGGFHGKSTFLKALERSVYDHIKGDGREFVFTDEQAIKIRAEDGRSVQMVNISPFITHLPLGRKTDAFTTDNASGSTSQAANIMEALEAGATTLLIDEDTSATNFMIRDARMQALVQKDHEPITPFIDKVKQLYEEKGVSTILVMGGAGDYFDVADCIIKMEQYKPYDVTDEAKKISQTYPTERKMEGGISFGQINGRVITETCFNSQRGKKQKVVAKGKQVLQYGLSTIDLAAVEQLVHPSQVNAIGAILLYLERNNLFRKGWTIPEILSFVRDQIDQHGIQIFSMQKGHPGELVYVRPLELAAAINRFRLLKVK